MTVALRVSLWNRVVLNELACRSLQGRTYSWLDIHGIVQCRYIETKKGRQEITLEYINLKSRGQHDSESKGVMFSVASSYRVLPVRALNIIPSVQVRFPARF